MSSMYDYIENINEYSHSLYFFLQVDDKSCTSNWEAKIYRRKITTFCSFEGSKYFAFSYVQFSVLLTKLYVIL